MFDKYKKWVITGIIGLTSLLAFIAVMLKLGESRNISPILWVLGILGLTFITGFLYWAFFMQKEKKNTTEIPDTSEIKNTFFLGLLKTNIIPATIINGQVASYDQNAFQWGSQRQFTDTDGIKKIEIKYRLLKGPDHMLGDHLLRFPRTTLRDIEGENYDWHERGWPPSYANEMMKTKYPQKTPTNDIIDRILEADPDWFRTEEGQKTLFKNLERYEQKQQQQLEKIGDEIKIIKEKGEETK
jgi:hypothetical protein